METMIEQCAAMMRMVDGAMMGSDKTMGMMGGGMMGPMVGGMLLVWTLVIVASVVLVWLIWNRSSSGNGVAVRLLATRFASGEIDLEEYQLRRNVLQHRR